MLEAQEPASDGYGGVGRNQDAVLDRDKRARTMFMMSKLVKTYVSRKAKEKKTQEDSKVDMKQFDESFITYVVLSRPRKYNVQ